MSIKRNHLISKLLDEVFLNESMSVSGGDSDEPVKKPKFGELKQAVKGMRLSLQQAARQGKLDRSLGDKPTVGKVLKQAGPGKGMKTLAHAGAAGAGSGLSRAKPEVRSHLSDLIRKRDQG